MTQRDSMWEALEAYQFEGPVLEAKPYGSGHINDTFRVRCTGKDYILQGISIAAFPHPEQVMENMAAITRYLARQIRLEGGDPERETLQILPTRDGADFFRDSSGKVWRLLPFLEGMETVKTVTKGAFRESGRAFGHFQHLLENFPAHTLHETIARFHDTENRYALFEKAVEENLSGRKQMAEPEIEFVRARKADCSVVLDALREGKLPLRVTHNDTKIDNVLFDRKTGRAACVIDLDTTMPGLSVNDFGDSIRFGANHCAEDEQDLSKVSFDPELYRVYGEGYLEGTQGSLTDAELRYLPWGARLMTLECGIRFLTDFLDGDRYFHTAYPEHNLVRARTQLKLVVDMENHFAAMEAVTR